MSGFNITFLLLRLTFTAMLLSCCITSSGQKVITLGTHGAYSTVNDEWERKALTNDLGKDQFQLAKGTRRYYLIDIETIGMLEGKADFERAKNEQLVRFTGKHEVVGTPKYEQDNGIEQMAYSFDADLNGLKLRYRIRILSRDGLTYMLIAWAVRTRSLTLDRYANAFAAGISFPDKDSEWGKSTNPLEFKQVVQSQELSFKYRPSLFEDVTEKESLFDLESHDGNHAIYGMLQDWNSNDTEGLLNYIFKATNNDDDSSTYSEVQRIDIEVSGIKGRMILAKSSEELGHFGHFIILPIGGDNYLDLRYFSVDKNIQDRSDFELFFKSLSIKPLETDLTLPPLETKPQEISRSSYELSLLNASSKLALVPDMHSLMARQIDDGRIILVSPNRATVVDGAEQNDIIRLDRWQSGLTVIRWQDQWLTIDDQDRVIDTKSKEPFGNDMTACLLEASDKHLYFVKPRPKTSLLGFSEIEQLQVDHLVRLSTEGQQENILDFPGFRIEKIRVSHDESKALVVAEKHHHPTKNKWDQPVQLLSADLITAEITKLGRWQSIKDINEVNDGWLITGEPLDAVSGVYHLNNSGAMNLLISGNSYCGIDLANSQLLVVESNQNGSEIYSVPLEAANKFGALCHPFCVSSINRISEIWSEKLAQDKICQEANNINEIQNLFQTASTASEQVVGCPLPIKPEDVDEFIDDMFDADKLNPAAKQLITLTITNSLLEQGAEWITGNPTKKKDWIRARTDMHSSPFALGYAPAAIYTDSFHNGEGMWNAATSIFESANGRRVLLGHDPQALDEAITQCLPVGIAELLNTNDANDVITALNEVPNNLFFREEVYRHLIASGRNADLLKVAEYFVSAKGIEQANEIDLKAWFTARENSQPIGQYGNQLIADLQIALEKYPEEQLFYLLLGMVCERTPNDPLTKSRMCYQRVLEINSWSLLADKANEKLDSLKN